MKFKKLGVIITLLCTTSLLWVGCTKEKDISLEKPDPVQVTYTEDPNQEKFSQTMILAEKGDVEAQYNLAWMYSNGEGVEKMKL